MTSIKLEDFLLSMENNLGREAPSQSMQVYNSIFFILTLIESKIDDLTAFSNFPQLIIFSSLMNTLWESTMDKVVCSNYSIFLSQGNWAWMEGNDELFYCKEGFKECSMRW